MKSDLDRLMTGAGIDTIVVTGGVSGNPSMYYMTNGAAVTSGMVVRARGREPVLLHGPMEREEAERTQIPNHRASH